DRAIGAGDALVIPGLLGSSPTGRTNLIVQETSGLEALIAIDLLDPLGTVILTREETVPAFQHLRINDFAPAGTVAAALRVREGSAGRVLAYATPLDVLSGDTWVVTDWPRVLGYPSTARQIVPIAGRLLGGNNNFFRTSLAITNRGTAGADVTVRFASSLATTAEASVTVPPGQTRSWDDVLHDLLALDGGIGYLDIEPHGAPLAITSRTFATVGEDPKTFGTGVPPVAATGLASGERRRVTGIDDADTPTITAKIPATFRTNLGLVETSGKPVTVRVTLHFRHPQGTRLVSVGSGRREIQLNPNQFLLLQSVSREILGDYRNALQGNLKNLFLDVEIVGGEGSLIGFASSVDNGSADQLFKLE
ncbi:MAG: hypothetical protein LC732_08430, partial [Acidobacteria bacterium]|nr:hypothetical protein [Acidobacteriota bacterium]